MAGVERFEMRETATSFSSSVGNGSGVRVSCEAFADRRFAASVSTVKPFLFALEAILSMCPIGGGREMGETWRDCDAAGSVIISWSVDQDAAEPVRLRVCRNCGRCSGYMVCVVVERASGEKSGRS